MAELKKSLKKTDSNIEKNVIMAVKTLIHAIILGTTVSNTNWEKISNGIVNAGKSMGPIIESLVQTVIDNVGSGTLDAVISFKQFLLSGTWTSGIFIGLIASVIATNRDMVKVILDSYTEAGGKKKEEIKGAIDSISAYLNAGYFRDKTWGLMKTANNMLGGALLQPLVDGLNKKIEKDKKVTKGVIETNIETVKRQIEDAFVKDQSERQKAKAAEAATAAATAKTPALAMPTLKRQKSAPGKLGGRRTRRNKLKRKTRKYSKKQTKRRRKHSRSTKRRHRRSKLGKRRTKRN